MQKHAHDRSQSPTTLPDFTPVPRRYRQDGWTPARQHAFIAALADTGSVKHAAASIGMAPEGAYQLRHRPGAEGFAAAWLAALDHGVRQLEDIALERAIHGAEVPVYSYGKLVGTRRVYNDRLLMFILRNRAPGRFTPNATRKDNGGLTDKELEQLHYEWRQESEVEAKEGADRFLANIKRMRELSLARGGFDDEEGGRTVLVGHRRAEYKRWLAERGEADAFAPTPEDWPTGGPEIQGQGG